ncbi:MAG: ATP-binding cassette domain-containing protein [Muribaculaceae bacterium]|nr:ATP-binding cassette domain-containing protein [Muribaculaceae bacterium]
MLKINDCTFSYSRKNPPVIEDFSLTIDKGGIYGLLGSNGAGKSTLLNLICGLLTPDSGDVTLDGINTRKRLPETMSDLFIVPEEFDFPSMSLEKYVNLNKPFYPRFSWDSLVENLDLFGLSPEINIGKLSMGQKKKVALSFAMATNTKLVILDEPTNGLDIPGKATFRRFISAGADDDRIFIISTHQVRDVAQILDHIIIIDNHKVLLDRSVYDIQKHLKFVETTDRDLIDASLFTVSSIIGSAVVLPNYDGNDTEINLELLFQFAYDDPEGLKRAFQKSDHN